MGAGAQQRCGQHVYIYLSVYGRKKQEGSNSMSNISDVLLVSGIFTVYLGELHNVIVRCGNE